MKIVKGITNKPRRTLLYGVHGVGKSQWASNAPSPIFIDCEDGLNSIECERTEVCKSTADIGVALQYLEQEEHSYKTVVLDTADWAERLMHHRIAQEAGERSVADIGYGKGYTRAIPMWDQVLASFDKLRNTRGMNIIILAHAKIEKVELPDQESFDRYSIDLHKTTAGMIQEWCDDLLFANFRVITSQKEEGFGRKRNVAVGGKERYILTNEGGMAIAKNRIDLPEELPMDYAAYDAAVKAFYKGKKGIKPQPKVVGDLDGVVVDGSSKPGLEKTLQEEVEATF